MKSISKREIILIVAIIFLISGAVYYMYYFEPKKETIEETNMLIEQKQVRVLSMESAIGQIDNIKEQIAVLEEEIGKQTEDIPKGISQPLQLVEITNIMNQKCESLVISFDQGAQTFENYQKNTVKLNFSTDYEKLLQILDEFEELCMTNQISTMSILYTEDVLTYYTAVLEGYYLVVGITVEFYSFYEDENAEPIEKQTFENSAIEYKKSI